jgi:hypothetical protein
VIFSHKKNITIVSLLALFTLFFIAWKLWPMTQGPLTEIPVIKQKKEAFRVRPKNPGGLIVSDANLTVNAILGGVEYDEEGKKITGYALPEVGL